MVGDGYCSGALFNVPECGYDGGDCDEFNIKYPDCPVVQSPFKIGDGCCNNDPRYNNPLCLYDGRDCIVFNEKYPNCAVKMSSWVGNGICNGPTYNNAQCSFDGGDCVDFNLRYPDCEVNNAPELVGDGLCTGPEYNTTECKLYLSHVSFINLYLPIDIRQF